MEDEVGDGRWEKKKNGIRMNSGANVLQMSNLSDLFLMGEKKNRAACDCYQRGPYRG